MRRKTTSHTHTKFIQALLKGKHPLLKILSKMTLEDIESLCTDHVFRASVELFSENRLNTLHWNPSTQALRVEIISHDIFSVRIYAKKDRLFASCDCSSLKGSACKHSICVLISIKAALSPIPLLRHPLNSDTQTKILEELKRLLDHSEKPPKPKKMLLKNAPALILSCEDTLQITYFSRMEAPEEGPLKSYLGLFDPKQAEKTLLTYLEKEPNPLPLYWKNGDDFRKVTWESKGAGTAKTVLLLKKSYLTIARGVVGDQLYTNVLPLSPNLGIASKEKQLILLETQENWEPFYETESLFLENIPIGVSTQHDTSLRLSHNHFNALHFRLDPTQCSFIEIQTPVLPSEDSDALSLSYKTSTHHAVIQLSSEYDLIHRYADSIQDILGLFPQALLTKKRLPAVQTLISEVIRDTPEDQIDEQLSLFPWMPAAAPFVESIRNILHQSELPTVGIKNNRFVSIKSQLGQYWEAVQTISTSFDIPLNTILDIGEFTIALPLFQSALPKLSQALDKINVPQRINNKLVVNTTLDFELTVTNSKGFDWFELHPSIKHQGKSFSKTQLERILSGESQWIEGDTIQVLSAEAYETLEMIRKRLEEHSKKSKSVVRLKKLDIFDWLALKKRGVALHLDEKDQRIIDQLQTIKKVPSSSLPPKLNAKLRPYQKTGYNWLSFLYSHKFGGCLADEMGLGKTLQSIALLAGVDANVIESPYEIPSHCPHLIVAPPTLLFNWLEEIERFYPSFSVSIYQGKQRKIEPGTDIILISYDTLRSDISVLKKQPFHIIIFDEAQTIKNIQSGRTSAVRQLSGCFKLTLTGTPLENHLGEYYSVIDLCLPGLLGPYKTFQQLTKEGAYDEILEKTKLFILRRKKEDVLNSLPPKLETDVHLDLSDEQQVLYQEMVDRVRSDIHSAFREKTSSQASVIALTAILRLRQLCVSPALLDPNYTTTSPKISFLKLKLQEVIEEQNSALVFSQFRKGLDSVESILKETQTPYFRIDGDTPMATRKQLIQSFQSDSKPHIFLISLKTGGVGLNLTKANYIFHLDPWWNPAVEDQATARAHRIGQDKKVLINRLVMRHSVEEKMMQLKAQKSRLFEAIMSGTSQAKLTIGEKDFDFLLDT